MRRPLRCLGIPCAQFVAVIWMRFSEVVSFSLTIPMLPFYMQHLLGTKDDKDPRIEYRYVLSVGPETTPKAHSQWLYAAYAAGMEHTRVVETSSALNLIIVER